MSGRWRPAVLLFTLILVSALPARAQFWDSLTNPKVSTRISHPPGLGIQVRKVAFGPESGTGAKEFTDKLSERFVSAGVEVIEREQLDTLLREHNFNRSAYADPYAAPEMGKILGPSVMVFANMQRYTTDKKRLTNDWKDGKGVRHRTYISQLKVYVRASVRAVDLATGRRFAQQVLDETPVFENKINDDCCAEYPDEYQGLDAAMNTVVERAARMFVPWNEVVDLYYFDDKDCGLKQAYNRHKGGDIQGALDQSLLNIDTCKALPKQNDKVLGHAYHNVGMGYFATGDLPKALEYLNEAERIKPGKIFEEAIAECRRAATLAEQMQRVEDRAEAEAAAADRKAAQSQAAAEAQVIGNKDVLALIAAKLPAGVIVAKIKAGPCKFDTGTDALIALSNAGASPEIITAMMESPKK
jgi:hypothetical protein